MTTKKPKKNKMMKTRTHYSKAPISEAVVALRVTLPENTKIQTLDNIHPTIKTKYPGRGDAVRFEGQMSTGAEVSATASQTHHGFAFLSKDGRQIIQARLDGFTFSRREPYEAWEPFRDEARELWNIYRSACQPEAVTRVAVRYINRLDLPLPLKDFRDYLRTAPEVSPDLEQGLDGYFFQLQIPLEDMKAQLVINEAMIPPSNPDVVSVLLDIDLFRTDDVPEDEAAMWEYFEALHDRKNRVFEACITDNMRELIR